MPFEGLSLGELFWGIAIYVVITWGTVIHVLLHKRNSRAAFGWLGLVLVFPLAGALLYLLFGVNRVQRKARRISQELGPVEEEWPEAGASRGGSGISKPGYGVTGRHLVPGNEVGILHNGEAAFPAMLEAIEGAKQEVLLSSYIFDRDETGLKFIAALQRARERGCRVCVLVDDAGSRYSFPTIIRSLKQADLPYRRFMPFRFFPPSFSINLRTHRKILCCDRSVAFAGGMNIGDRQLVHGPSRHKAVDLHFRFEGSLTADFVHLFADDWKFAGGEDLDLSGFESRRQRVGDAECRLVSDGPDENLDALLLTLIGVMASARQRIWIMSPYFLPERQMMGCLQAAALSGIDVRVLIPAKNNWPVVQWALQHNMIELLNSGVRIFSRPSPFAHSKCILIDNEYSMVGSSNLDPRSLRLNFELGVEVFDDRLNAELEGHFREVLLNCVPITADQINNRNTFVKLRDSASSLFSPYL